MSLFEEFKFASVDHWESATLLNPAGLSLKSIVERIVTTRLDYVTLQLRPADTDDSYRDRDSIAVHDGYEGMGYLWGDFADPKGWDLESILQAAGYVLIAEGDGADDSILHLYSLGVDISRHDVEDLYLRLTEVLGNRTNLPWRELFA
jgi:hypothetical protein